MKLTKKDYDWCYKKMKYWQKELGVMNCNCRLTMHLDDSIECGQCVVDVTSSTGEISLSASNYWNSKQELERVIFHEVCEAMLYIEFGYYMTEMYSDDFIASKTHAVIRRLENLMFK